VSVRWLLLVVVAVPLVLIGGPYIFFHLAGGSSAPPLTLPVGPGGTTGPVTGTWTVTRPSQAQYRVAETLLGQHHLAVGSTSKVSGTIIIQGATITYAHFRVDMGSVSSDQAGRDVMFRDHILATYSHPYGDFDLTQPIDLNSVPGPNQRVDVTAVGKLALRGVTQPVNFPLSAERDGNEIVVNGSLRIRFAEWHIPNPSFGVAQVGDYGTIGVLLYLQMSK
jgi:polyisoprenoid-binding protein YceI